MGSSSGAASNFALATLQVSQLTPVNYRPGSSSGAASRRPSTSLENAFVNERRPQDRMATRYQPGSLHTSAVTTTTFLGFTSRVTETTTGTIRAGERNPHIR
jgi:hypothetical protein